MRIRHQLSGRATEMLTRAIIPPTRLPPYAAG